jgi:hypothetical protein
MEMLWLLAHMLRVCKDAAKVFAPVCKACGAVGILLLVVSSLRLQRHGCQKLLE